MGILDRYGRFVWGGAALLLLLVLVGSVVLSGYVRRTHGTSARRAD